MSDLRFQSFTNEDDETSQYSGRIGDKAQANRDGAASGGFRKNVFSLEFYQQYFDVDTDQVFSRILHSMNPMRGNFITESIQPIPDLYGPFWISVTLIFVTGIFGNIAQYIESGGQKGANGIEGSDFRMVTGASSLVMSYVILVPAALYCLLWYRKVSLHYSYLEILSAYGYSLAIFIPVSALWTVDWNLFRWVLIGVAVLLSGTVLAKAFWNCLQSDPNRLVAIGTVFGILLLHFLLAICFKEYFFDTAHPAVAKATASLPSGDLPPTVVNPQAGAVNDTAPAAAAAQVKDTKSNETKSVEEKSAEKKTDESEDKNKKPDENFPKNQSVRRPKGKDEKTPKPT